MSPADKQLVGITQVRLAGLWVGITCLLFQYAGPTHLNLIAAITDHFQEGSLKIIQITPSSQVRNNSPNKCQVKTRNHLQFI